MTRLLRSFLWQQQGLFGITRVPNQQLRQICSKRTMAASPEPKLSTVAPKEADLGLSRPNSALGIGTRLISLHTQAKELDVKPIITPIHQTASYRRVNKLGFKSESGEQGYVYSRRGNPNTDEACMIINSLERGAGSLIYPSGMSALFNTFMCFLSPGDQVIAGAPLYSCAQKMFDKYFAQFNIEVEYVPSYGDSNDVIDGYRKAIRPNTKILFGETICNPMMWVLDVPTFAALGKEKGIMTVLDATFTPPVNMTVLKMGIDVVVHSSSKYIAGHSDMLSGCTTLAKAEDHEKLYQWTALLGPSVSPTEAAMLVRSLRTLEVRMSRINENALKVAQFFEGHPTVKRTLYAGLESHPHHELAKRLMKGYGGAIMIELESSLAAITLIESTKVFSPASSLGGVEGLINHTATQSHRAEHIPVETREKHGIKDSMVRISVGIEDVEDIIDDLNIALQKSMEACREAEQKQ